MTQYELHSYISVVLLEAIHFCHLEKCLGPAICEAAMSLLEEGREETITYAMSGCEYLFHFRRTLLL